MTHICVGNLTTIGSDNGLSPGRRQAIIWTNAGIMLIGPLETKFSEILIDTLTFSFNKMCLKMSSAKWRPFCLGLNVLSFLAISIKLTFLIFETKQNILIKLLSFYICKYCSTILWTDQHLMSQPSLVCYLTFHCYMLGFCFVCYTLECTVICTVPKPARKLCFYTYFVLCKIVVTKKILSCRCILYHYLILIRILLKLNHNP